MINGKWRSQSISRTHSLENAWRALVVIDLYTPGIGSGNASIMGNLLRPPGGCKGCLQRDTVIGGSEPWNPRVNLTISKAKHWVS